MAATQHAAMQDSRLSSLKRPHPDDDAGEQRLSKRFNLLNLEKDGGKLYIPVSADGPDATTLKASKPRDDFMQVEDTKDKVYIHDLDQELSSSDEGLEDEQDRLIFLPDIEKKLHGFPRHLLMGDRSEDKRQTQLVLYSVPTSITVPQSQDSVRKAIIESRARQREAAAAKASQDSMLHDQDEENATESTVEKEDEDEDAMDIG